MLRMLAYGVLAVALAACTTTTPYGAAADGRGYGYSEQRIEQNRYRIMFRGNSSTPRDHVENSLLYRAAELTLKNGYDYFVVVESDTEARRSYSTTTSPAFGAYRYGYPGFYRFPYYAYGWGWGYPYDTYTREVTRYSAVAFITMHRGEKPSGDPHAFSAREVEANLRSLVLGA
jgi:hypothetical protein